MCATHFPSSSMGLLNPDSCRRITPVGRPAWMLVMWHVMHAGKPTAPCEQNDTQVWKHYLPATSFPDGKNGNVVRTLISIRPVLEGNTTPHSKHFIIKSYYYYFYGFSRLTSIIFESFDVYFVVSEIRCCYFRGGKQRMLQNTRHEPRNGWYQEFLPSIVQDTWALSVLFIMCESVRRFRTLAQNMKFVSQVYM